MRPFHLFPSGLLTSLVLESFAVTFNSIFAGMDVVSEIKEESPPPWAADGCEYTPSVTC